MKSEAKFAPIASNFHQQNFAVELDENKLFLVVFSEDGESFKRLGPWAEIVPAEPIKHSWQVKTTYEGYVEGGRSYKAWDRNKNVPLKKNEEYSQLQNMLAASLIDKVISLFPQGKYAQFADPAQKEVSATRLKEIRKSLDMTQLEFAEYLGVARRTEQDWELGNRKIPNTVVEILKAKGQI